MASQDKKFCYFIDGASSLKREIAEPFVMGVPIDRICTSRLKKKDAEICGLGYSVKTSEDTDYSKLRVKDLKQILRDRGVACQGCLEKADFIKKVKATNHMDL